MVGAPLGREGAALPAATENGLDVIVRFHAIARLPELQRCLLSLIGQTYRPLTVHIVTQRFQPGDTAIAQHLVDTLARLEPDAAFHIHNFTDPEPADARSSLVNLGYANLRGRYVYLLDYDDVTSPHGCQTLVTDLLQTGAAISFGHVIGAHLTVDWPIIMSRTRQDLYVGNGLVDMLRQNFCPIHSFMIDRSRAAPDALWFDPARSRDEDYDFLIRFCAEYPSSFAKKDYVVGLYGLKDDGSNTVVGPGVTTETRMAEWRRSFDLLTDQRSRTRVSPRVQRQLGLVADPALTVARLVKETPQ